MILPWKSYIFSINQSLKKNWKDFDGVQQVWWCMSLFKAPRFEKSLDFGHVKIHKNRHSSYLESFEIQMKILQRDGSHGRQKFNVGLRVIYSRNRFSAVGVARLNLSLSNRSCRMPCPEGPDLPCIKIWMKESKNETMETLAERNQNAAKRQLYYIFVLVAGLIAVLFLLFIIKKITKRFTYRKSSYQILVFGRSNTADRALYFLHMLWINKKVKCQQQIPTPKISFIWLSHQQFCLELPLWDRLLLQIFWRMSDTVCDILCVI